MSKFSEVEIGEIVTGWLSSRGWEVYQEVQLQACGKVADIIAVKNKEVWIVELKTTFTMRLIEQAYDWKTLANYISIAVPCSDSRSYFPGVVATEFNISVIEVSENGVYHRGKKIPLLAKPKIIESQVLNHLSEIHKTYNKAGSQNGHLTPYSYMMDLIKEYLIENPFSSTKEIVEALGIFHYAHEKSAKGNISRALSDYEKWAGREYGKGKYRYYVLRQEEETNEPK